MSLDLEWSLEWRRVCDIRVRRRLRNSSTEDGPGVILADL
jgi:hypothetical protein